MAKLMSRIESVLEITIAIMLAVLVSLTFAAVFFRYVLQNSLVWADEFLRYFNIWMVFLCGPLLVTQKSHIAVDLTSLLLPKGCYRWAIKSGHLLAIVFLIILIFPTAKIVKLGMNNTSPSVQIPMGLVYLIMPISVSYMAVNFIRLLLFDKETGVSTSED